MSIYISGMEMPTKAKDEVITIYPDGTVLKYSLDSDFHNAKSRAIEVPPHGRLIDADNLDKRDRGNNSQRIMWSNIRQIVAEADTIIPADPEEEEPT